MLNILTHTTQTHHPSPAQIQAHLIPSGTRLAQSYQDSCFLHDANMLARQGMSQGTCTLALRASQGVIVTLRGERREREEKEREKREPPLPFPPPCAGSKRLRVYRQNARMCSTCARFAGIHGDVLNLHTGEREVSAVQAAPHTDNTHPTQTTHTTDHRHHTPHIAQSTPAPTPYITHIPHTLSAHTPHTLSTHTHNHFNTHDTHTPHTPHHTHNAHKYHTKPTHTYTHHRQPILIPHSIKICNICNVCTVMRIYCFWN